MPRRFTRQEFYDLVWSKPITHIAKDFGLSDVAIHKICKKNGVPNPPLGYWAKKASGKPVTQTAFQHDPDLVFGREVPTRRTPDVLHHPLRRSLGRRFF